MKDAIKMAAGILVAVLLVAFLVSGFLIARGRAEKALDEGISTIDNAALAKYTDFDGRTDVTGSTVLQFIKDRENYNDGMYIAVGSVSYVYTKTTDGSGTKLAKSAEQALIKNANTRGNAAYINPQAKYSVTCDYAGTAGNEVLIGITFTKN